jgi:peptidoglycan hydrolase-like protein with peptidoglycan-binding domain
METLAYLHLALSYETPTDISLGERRLDWRKFSSHAWMYLLPAIVAMRVLGMPSQVLALVQEGDRSPEVSVLQQRLQQLGYFQGNITGYFGALTKQAVIQFQQAKGLIPDGIVGTNTQASLGEQPKLNPQPLRESSTSSSSSILQLGDRGSQVSALQESLALAGFSGGVKGIFDEATQDAVKRFQQAKGLMVDGVVGSQTRAALPTVGGSKLSSVPENATNFSDIKALQKRLQQRGFYRGSIDGLWGPKTQAALEAAQRAYSVGADDIAKGGF